MGPPQSLPNNSMIKVYFDGKCGLCSKEINYYQKPSPSRFAEWIDIAADPSPLKDLSISQRDALKRLHVQDNAGNIKSGITAFLLIWDALPGWRSLGRIISLPVIYHLVDSLYGRFAEYSFKLVNQSKFIE